MEYDEETYYEMARAIASEVSFAGTLEDQAEVLKASLVVQVEMMGLIAERCKAAFELGSMLDEVAWLRHLYLFAQMSEDIVADTVNLYIDVMGDITGKTQQEIV